MLRPSLGEVHDRPSSPACCQAQIDVFVVEEKALVETLEPLEQRPSDQQERTHDLVDRPRIAMVPFDEEMRRHERRKNPVQEQGSQQERGGSGGAGATAADMTLRVEQLDAYNADTGVGRIVQICSGAGHSVRPHDDIRIEEQHVGSAASPGALIACRGKAAIRVVEHDIEAQSLGSKSLGRAVVGGIIDNDRPEVFRIDAPIERSQAFTQEQV